MTDLVRLPFNFRRLDDCVVISNLSGQHHLLSDKQFNNFVNSKFTDIEPQVLASLESKSFICSNDELNLRGDIMASKFASRVYNSLLPPSLFLVVPTLRCDHDCHYCQVSRVTENSSGYDLEETQIHNIIAHIKFLSGKQIKIEFQGGEPLLNFPFVKKFITEANKALEDKEIIFIIATALGPIDSTKLQWLQNNNVQLSVSLDGPEEIHNKNRPSKTFNSFINTSKVVADIQKNYNEIDISALSTITRESLKSPLNIVDSYCKLNLNELFIRPLSPYGFATDTWSKIGYSADDYMLFYEEILSHIVETKSQMVEYSALIHLRRIFSQSNAFVDLKSPAGIVFGAVCFDYNGNIFGSDESRMLWTKTKSSELVIGRVDDAPKETYSNKNLVTLLKDTFIELTPGCSDCSYSSFCGSDPIHHLSTQGDLIGHKAKSFFCQIQTRMFDLILNKYYSDASYQKVFNGWLNKCY